MRALVIGGTSTISSAVVRLPLTFILRVSFAQGVRLVLDNILAHPELQREDKEFDRWCDKVIEALKRIKDEFH